MTVRELRQLLYNIKNQDAEIKIHAVDQYKDGYELNIDDITVLSRDFVAINTEIEI